MSDSRPVFAMLNIHRLRPRERSRTFRSPSAPEARPECVPASYKGSDAHTGSNRPSMAFFDLFSVCVPCSRSRAISAVDSRPVATLVDFRRKNANTYLFSSRFALFAIEYRLRTRSTYPDRRCSGGRVLNYRRNRRRPGRQTIVYPPPKKRPETLPIHPFIFL